MSSIAHIVDYLKIHQLVLTTAESCTAGRIISLLANIAGCGNCLDVGYVVYSEDAKKRVLNVKTHTIDQYTLTSEEVAREMAEGALKHSAANLVVATTGIAGDQPMDGIAPGTVCIAWGAVHKEKLIIHSVTKYFKGSRKRIQTNASRYALLQIPTFYEKIVR